MNIQWLDKAWDEYLNWQSVDSKTLRKINNLIKNICRNGYKSTGKPEQLKGDLADYWSVRIDKKNRIVFRVVDGSIEIIQCGSHYRD